MRGAREIGPADPGSRVEVTIRLRPRAAHAAEDPGKRLHERRYMTRPEFAELHGAEAAALARVEAFAREHNLAVKETSAARRTVVLTGAVGDMNAAFGVELKEYEHAGG